MIQFPESASAAHCHLVQRCVDYTQAQQGFWGLAIGGSWATDSMDFASDLDFNLVVAPEAYAEALKNAEALAQCLGPCLSFAPAYHTGESRLFNALYQVNAADESVEAGAASPLIQVDFKYFKGSDFRQRVEQPVILWERESQLAQILEQTQGQYPPPDLAWIEAQFWRWVYYGVLKWQRGELIEVADHLSFLRNQVLGPLLLMQYQQAPRRVRRIEQYLPAALQRDFKRTLVRPEPWPLLWAIHLTCQFYIAVRDYHLQRHSFACQTEAQTQVLAYLERLLQPRRYLYHIATLQDWEQAQRQGYYGASLKTEGFIHFAYAHQIQGVYQRYYQGQPNLKLLKIAPEDLRAELREENLYGGQENFPHLYGVLPLSALQKSWDLSDASAQVLWPENLFQTQ